jgi:hypothetical protein
MVKCLIVWLLLLGALVTNPLCALAEAGHPVCGTSVEMPEGDQAGRACPLAGACDDPAVRNENIPGLNSPWVGIRLFINVVAEDDGSNPGSSEAVIAAQIATLNSTYAPSRIRFIYEWRIVTSSQLRYGVELTGGGAGQVRAAFNYQPANNLNVNVTGTTPSGGIAVFPWSAPAIGAATGHCRGCRLYRDRDHLRCRLSHYLHFRRRRPALC